MNPLSSFLLFWSSLFLGCLFCAIALQHAGYISDAVATLSGQAIAAAQGGSSFSGLLTAYPPLPRLLTYVVALMEPRFPALVAGALLLSLLGSLLYQQMAGKEDDRFNHLSAAASALLLLAGPHSLLAMVEGPEAVLMALAIFVLGQGMFDLRSEASAVAAMKIALAMMLLVLSGPTGMIFAIACLPFLALCLPGDLRRQRPDAIYLTFLFPALFGIGSFLYLRWLFGANDAATGISGAFQTLSLTEPAKPSTLAAALIALAALGPPLAWKVLRSWRKPVLMEPLTGLILSVAAAAVLTFIFHTGRLPILMTASVLGVLATCIARVSVGRWAMIAVLAIGTGTALGWIAFAGNVSGARGISNVSSSQSAVAELRPIAEALDSLDGVMLDGISHPQILTFMSSTNGLSLPGSTDFEIDLLRKAITAPFFAVPDPMHAAARQGRINRAFPEAFDHGLPGYERIYDENGWRIYARVGQAGGW
ncbi:hypothetical protein [Notoacmeibacter ruber]|uniref:Glycosyltransferase RgtA/B/C/D-like domain-containing protein n=1 Tax=Notoacmeibacter ruber TaxID=2670375 RepID=A0A3L7JDJ2_9HYPH|nr:hypothetical protein [Notoacmeibacter ruber]RLQ88858.1 hypothetical protein D8780_12125 [Notoacmeibacter ruber]